jgi:hypothetical protein
MIKHFKKVCRCSMYAEAEMSTSVKGGEVPTLITWFGHLIHSTTQQRSFA